MTSKRLSLQVCMAVAVTACGSDGSVRSYEQTLLIPTYEVDRPDPNPRFYSGRVYQGAQGRVYPYPMLDQLTDNRVQTPYKLLYLENEYLKIGVLPEIGGRVFEAKDKTNEYDFLYRQHVIKPALIGMLGAWISGGIEWNFPHHHRSRGFMPMDYTMLDGPDGAKTIWLSELEFRQRMQFTVGITVYHGKSFFEATIKPYNGTPFAQSFLYWANPAVHAGPAYQVIFPPSTQYATYHGKNDFVNWPIARSPYRGIPYGDVDLSWWSNHPAPISFFAWNYHDDFLAGYDHERDAGVVYFANHHIAPGKKLWEWGPGPEGRMWDQILTDEDGPYIELMAGAYSDNQPDYSWLQPYEQRLIKQYWYPVHGIGGVKNATLEAAVNLEANDGIATLGFHTTSIHDSAIAQLAVADSVILRDTIYIDPGTPYYQRVALPPHWGLSDLRASLIADGNVLVSHQIIDHVEMPRPETVTPPPPPDEMETLEELYLAGQRLEQFHNPTLDANAYYREALTRDPGDSRSNIALGINSLKQGLFSEAADRFMAALDRVTKGYTSPRDGEAFYYLGLARQFSQQNEAAYDAFYRATWSSAFQSAAYYRLAQIDCLRRDFVTALGHLDQSIITNARNRHALNLRAAVLRHLGRYADAADQLRATIQGNALDVWTLNELYQVQLALTNAAGIAQAEKQLVARRLAKFVLTEHSKPWHEAESWLDAQPFLEVAAEYSTAALWDDALGVLSVLTDSSLGVTVNTYPVVYYWAGYLAAKLENDDAAAVLLAEAAKQNPDYCFPFRLETVDVLQLARRYNSTDPLALYCLGNLLYERQPQRALEVWESAAELGTTIPTVYRNLAQAYVRLEQDIHRAVNSTERAVRLNPSDPRLYYELDLMYEAGGLSPAERLGVLEQAHSTIANHNDALGREVVLLTLLGHYDTAIELMNNNHFRRWEGLGNIHTTYVDAHLLRAAERIRAGRFSDAMADYQAALQYPRNLEVGEPYQGGRGCEVHYLMGEAHRTSGDSAAAAASYKMAVTASRGSGRSALDYYQGMALRRLGRHQEAQHLFDALATYARGRLESLKAGSALEFFTKFGSRTSLNEQRAEAYYLLGLAYLGNGDQSSARAMLYQALEHNPNHLWARAHLAGS
jgi:tetratricopeptide (TPR) repeat protein